MHLRRLLPILLLTLPLSAQQQRTFDSNFNGWLIYTGDHPVSKRWGVHLEGQARRYQGLVQWQQWFVRPAVNYQLNKNWMLSGGYLYVDTYRYGDFPVPFKFPEHRFYQQAQLTQTIGKFIWAHRYRLEQRQIGEMESGEVSNWRYENRFRYMLRADLRWKSGWGIAAYNEFFVNFGKNVGANVFDQNRAYLVVTRKVGKYNRIEAGYLHQLLQQRNGRIFESNHTLQLAWYSTLPFGRVEP